MGSTTPRHRAEVPKTAAWSDLHRRMAHLLAGRDLYADDQILRPAVDHDEFWKPPVPPAAPQCPATANA